MDSRAAKNFSIFIVLLLAFIDYFGVGLVYPLFSSMLFDPALPFFPPETSNIVRGFFLGLLLGLQPLVSFFSAPLLGMFSDQKGRKSLLIFSLIVAAIGYAIGWYAVSSYSIIGLLLLRIVVGVSAGSTSVVQASLADVSTPKNKPKNFGLYNMALGTGFTLGPFLGGKLADPNFLPFANFSTPFLLTVVIVLVNLLLAIFFFQETLKIKLNGKLSLLSGLKSLKKAFYLKGLKALFVLAFIFMFGWSFFFEFFPVYLIDRFSFNVSQLGNFYGLAGGGFAISSGLLIRPIVDRIPPYKLFLGAGIFMVLIILAFLLVVASWQIYSLVVVLSFFVACIFPSITTLVSNKVDESMQGEILGVLSSTFGLALALSPFFSGIIVGAFPILPIFVGSFCMLIVSLFLSRKNIKSSIINSKIS